MSPRPSEWVITVFTFLFGTLLIGPLILRYLKPARSEERDEFPFAVRAIADQAGKLNQAIEEIGHSLRQKETEEATSDVMRRLNEWASCMSKIEIVNELFLPSLRRLWNETIALSKRGNINLVLGLSTTAVGVYMLAYLAFGSDGDGSIYTFEARLGVVIIVQVFAYFFLRLYKSSLDEIKYFQNEMTNLECRRIAVVAAICGGHEEVCRQAIQDLGATERNNILQKGQSTLELEKARLDKDAVMDAAQKLIDIVSKK